MSKEETEYCIWTYEYGQMDTSTNWEKLFDFVNRQIDHKKYWIIPIENVGSKNFRSMKQLDEDYKQSLIESEISMKKTNEVIKKTDELMKRLKT